MRNMLAAVTIACAALYAASAVAQDADDDISFEVVKEIIGLLVDERLDKRLSVIRQSIVLTEKKCHELGEGWDSYGPISGRFPLSSGTGVDDREQKREFNVHEHAGAYRHVLSVDEMPIHSHPVSSYEWGHTINGNGQSRRIDVDDGPPWSGYKGRLETETRGKNKSHNNMPPYLVLNYCHHHQP